MPRCRECCPCPIANASARRCAPAWRSRRRSTSGAGSTARTTSTPILPQGYQISQLYHPIVGEGQLLIEADEKAGIPEDKVIGIERIHVEQDAGKLMHDQHPTMSYVDLNRTGVALMEIVSRPDMTSPAEAGAYIRKLRAILRYVGSCDGNMEEGSMRADVNVIRAQGGRYRAWHADGNEERQFRALRDAGDRARGAAPDRRDRGWRKDRAGNPPVRSRHRHHADACAARKTRTITAISPIPTCCR